MLMVEQMKGVLTELKVLSLAESVAGLMVHVCLRLVLKAA
jgi:hypothetical protein